MFAVQGLTQADTDIQNAISNVVLEKQNEVQHFAKHASCANISTKVGWNKNKSNLLINIRVTKNRETHREREVQSISS